MPISEQLENEIMRRARQAQQSASPMQQSPWLARLVADVVQTTLELVDPYLSTEGAEDDDSRGPGITKAG